MSESYIASAIYVDQTGAAEAGIGLEVGAAFKAGARWQSEQPLWVSVKDRLPEDDENIIIMCEHGAIFNGAYCNGAWFCMDGYLYDTYKGNPIYSSMTGIPTLWEPIAWMPIPKFNEYQEK